MVVVHMCPASHSCPLCVPWTCPAAAAQPQPLPPPSPAPEGLLPAIFSGLAFLLPPTAALVQQAAVVYLAVAAAGVQPYCTSVLLSDPLSVARMAALHRLLDAADALTLLTTAATQAPQARTGQ